MFNDVLFLNDKVKEDLISKGEVFEFLLHTKFVGYDDECSPLHNPDFVEKMKRDEEKMVEEFRKYKSALQSKEVMEKILRLLYKK
jgi:hypothetical protein